MRGAVLAGVFAAPLCLLPLPANTAWAATLESCGKGKLALNARHYEESLSFYRDCLATDSLGRDDRLDAHFNAGMSLRRLGRPAEAADHFAQAVALAPDFAPATVALADVLEDAGRYAEALTALDAYDAAQPAAKNGELLETRGHVNVYLRRYEDAIQAFNAAADLGVESHRLLMNRGFSLAALTRYEGAYADFRAAIAIDPDNLRPYSYYGYNLRLQKRYDEALAVLNKALEKDPGYVNALIERGNLKLDQDNFRAAIADFTEVIALDPDNSMAFANRALAHSYQDDHEGVLADADAALALEPRSALALHLRGEELNRLGRFEEARRDLQIYVTERPENSAGHRELATSLMRLGLWKESLAELNWALEIKPGKARYHGARGYVRLRVGDGEGGVSDLDHAVAAEPNDFKWYVFRAQALAWLGREEEAGRDITAALELTPGAEKGWQSNEICWELLLQARTELAAPICERAVDLDNAAPALDSRAFLFWQQGKTVEAKADLARARSVARNPSFFEPKKRITTFPITLAQGLLTFLGYQPDLPDSEPTERTRQAVAAFRRDHGLGDGAEIDLDLLDALKAARP